MLNILLLLIYLRMGPDRFRDRMFGRDPYPPPPPPPFLRDRMLSGGFGKVRYIGNTLILFLVIIFKIMTGHFVHVIL